MAFDPALIAAHNEAEYAAQGIPSRLQDPTIAAAVAAIWGSAGSVAPTDLTIPNQERSDPGRDEEAVTSGLPIPMSFDSTTSPIASEEVRREQG